MNKTEQAFLNGFVKASSFGVNLGELLARAAKRARAVAGEIKIPNPATQNVAGVRVPPAFKYNQPTKAEFLAQQRANQQAANHNPLAVALRDKNLGWSGGPQPFHKLVDAARGLGQTAGKTLSKGTEWVKANPIKTIGGAVIGGGGLVRNVMTDTGVPAELKDPAKALEAWKEMHKPQDPLALGNMASKLKQSIIDNPIPYGIGTVGLGGLGYYMHKQRKDKSQTDEQSLNPAELQYSNEPV